tara:strand:- start:388 stop:654 length:267 start_codon:yes stop_codon:yes gene_type:complete
MINLFIKKQKIAYHVIVILSFTLINLVVAKKYGTDGDKKRFSTFENCLYFSTITHSTVGYGDLFPESKALRRVAMLHIFVMLSIVFSI